MIMKYRKRFNIFHAYYEQLMNMGDVMQTSVNGGLSEEEKAQWQLFSNRAERLHDHVEMLREYLVQIRELYQSLIAVQQNQVMSILTVVTTIFSAAHADRRLVWNEFSKYAGVWVEICVSGSYNSEYLSDHFGNYLF